MARALPLVVDYKPANARYSSSLLDHTERLFAFADKHRGSYTRTFPELSAYYNSTTYQDELLWAASWLYHATGNQSYLSYATGKNADEFANLRNPREKKYGQRRSLRQVFSTPVRCNRTHDLRPFHHRDPEQRSSPRAVLWALGTASRTKQKTIKSARSRDARFRRSLATASPTSIQASANQHTARMDSKENNGTRLLPSTSIKVGQNASHSSRVDEHPKEPKRKRERKICIDV